MEEIRYPAVSSLEVRRVLASQRPHYIYILCRPNGEPFYVGKGVNHRCLHHEAEARNTRALTHKLNLIRSLHRKSLNVGYHIAASFDLETEAHSHERHLIALIGRHDQKRGPLTNQTDGGEGASNPSEESRQRRRDSLWGEAAEPERQLANHYFQKLTPVRSIPIKAVASFARKAGLWKNDDAIGMRPRQAAALLASVIQNRILLEPGALIPRRFALDGVEFMLENGVGRDVVSNGMITLHDATPTHEVLCLSDLGFRFILDRFGSEILLDAGILLPG